MVITSLHEYRAALFIRFFMSPLIHPIFSITILRKREHLFGYRLLFFTKQMFSFSYKTCLLKTFTNGPWLRSHISMP